ncbi:MAG: YlzJ-like family protein [Bacillota bacterium]
MILYTPMPLELVTEGFEEMKQPVTRLVFWEGIPLIIEDTGSGRGRVVRLLSTEPEDYLRTDLFPGAVVRY